MDLKRDKRQNIQKKLGFSSEPTGEARQARREETESRQTMHEPESPANTTRLMEALRRVKGNKGSGGIDGKTVGQLNGYLKEHWLTIREQLLNGTYKPQPVRRVEIEKPDGGGTRKLGVPTTLDRFLQQAVMQVVQRRWDRTFSDHSYGFRLRANDLHRVRCRPVECSISARYLIPRNDSHGARLAANTAILR